MLHQAAAGTESFASAAERKFTAGSRRGSLPPTCAATVITTLFPASARHASSMYWARCSSRAAGPYQPGAGSADGAVRRGERGLMARAISGSRGESGPGPDSYPLQGTVRGEVLRPCPTLERGRDRGGNAAVIRRPGQCCDTAVLRRGTSGPCCRHIAASRRKRRSGASAHLAAKRCLATLGISSFLTWLKPSWYWVARSKQLRVASAAKSK